jgi:beta-lactamase class A
VTRGRLLRRVPDRQAARRLASVSLAAGWLLSAPLAAPASQDAAPGAAPRRAVLDAEIQAVASSLSGELGLAARDLATGETIALHADRRFPTASLIKIAVMLEVFHQMQEGRLDRSTAFELTDEVKVGGSGILRHLRPGLRLRVTDLVTLMIALSDNTATNLLVARVGTANIDRRLAGYGLANTHIFRPTFRDGRADIFPELEREFGLGMTTPAEAIALLELIARGRAVSPEASAEMLDVLRRQQDDLMIPRLLPFDREAIRVGHKTGTDEEKQPGEGGVRGHIRTDAAIVEGPRATYVIAICTRRVRDTRWSPDNAALLAGARLSRLVYDYFNR